MLEGLKFRKLDNGYTVKYYAAIEDNQGKFAGELYVTDAANLKVAVLSLIDSYLERDQDQEEPQ